MPELPPIRREVLVDAAPALAFAVFTEQIGTWWPLGDLGVLHDGTVRFVEGRLVEIAADGREAVWGTVTEWAPPSALAFTWHPGRDAASATRVEVAFEPVGDRTRVTLVHRGWEVLDDPASAKEEYEHGWPAVIARYAAAVSDDADPDAATWVALLHSPAGAVGSDVFQDERFAHHVAFLGRMRAAGWLVAAGSFADAAGQGMTVLRLPGEGRLGEATALAEADLSVVLGLFELQVRPWSVVLAG